MNSNKINSSETCYKMFQHPVEKSVIKSKIIFYEYYNATKTDNVKIEFTREMCKKLCKRNLKLIQNIN